MAPNLPLSILRKSSLDFNFKCFGLGLNKGANYINLSILNKTPTNGLNSFSL